MVGTTVGHRHGSRWSRLLNGYAGDLSADAPLFPVYRCDSLARIQDCQQFLADLDNIAADAAIAVPVPGNHARTAGRGFLRVRHCLTFVAEMQFFCVPQVFRMIVRKPCFCLRMRTLCGMHSVRCLIRSGHREKLMFFAASECPLVLAERQHQVDFQTLQRTLLGMPNTLLDQALHNHNYGLLRRPACVRWFCDLHQRHAHIQRCSFSEQSRN